MAIKKLPEDFIVEEVLEPAVAGRLESRGPLAVYRLSKTSLSTPEATSGMARQLKLRAGAVMHAGLKDKHAQTLQHVTVQTGGRAMPQTLDAPQWSARLLGYTHEPVTSAAIAANRFHITLRTLTQKDLERIGQRTAAVKLPGSQGADYSWSLLAVNYFGDQRFGSARSGGGEHEGFLAPLLIAGAFEEAMRQVLTVHHRKDVARLKFFKRTVGQKWGRWRELMAELPDVPEIAAVRHLASNSGDFRGAFSKLPYFFQQMVVDAYQSLLWNHIARRFVERRFGPAERLIVAADRFGDMIFPRAADVPAELLAMDLPILGEGAPLAGPWREAAESVLAEEGISTRDLTIPGLRRPQFGTVGRALFMLARRFTMDTPVADELQPKAVRKKVTVHFELPRGSYATVLLRAMGS